MLSSHYNGSLRPGTTQSLMETEIFPDRSLERDETHKFITLGISKFGIAHIFQIFHVNYNFQIQKKIQIQGRREKDEEFHEIF